jgi:DnaK suppressor protein
MDKTGVDIKRIRQKLKLRRQQILEFLKRLDDETQALDPDSAQDVADRSVLGMSKESLFERTSQQRIVLRMVDGALVRISDGSFGVCECCGRIFRPGGWTLFPGRNTAFDVRRLLSKRAIRFSGVMSTARFSEVASFRRHELQCDA